MASRVSDCAFPNGYSSLAMLHAQQLGRVVRRAQENLVEQALLAYPQQIGNQVVISALVGCFRRSRRKRQGGRSSVLRALVVCHSASKSCHVIVVIISHERTGRRIRSRDRRDCRQGDSILGTRPTGIRGGRRVLLTSGGYRRWLRGRVLLVTAVTYVHGGVHGFVLLAMAKHAVLQRKLPAADVAFKGPFARMSPHVTAKILRGPKSSHTKSTHYLEEIEK